MGTFLCEIDGTSGTDKEYTLTENGWTLDRTASREFFVVADSSEETHASLMRTEGLPTGLWGGLYANRVHVKENSVITWTDGPTLLVHVQIDYTNQKPPTSDDPLQWPVEESWGSEEMLVDMPVDMDGTTVSTVNRERIYLQRKVNVLTLTCTKYIAWPFDPETVFAFMNKTNNATWRGKAAGHWLCTSIHASKETFEVNEVSVEVTKLTASFKLSPLTEGWDAKVLHQGTKYRDATGNIVVDTDANGSPIGTINLDALGKKLTAGANPVFLTFKMYAQADFSGLGMA